MKVNPGTTPYAKRGPRWEVAWAMLAARLPSPPSLEVFEYGLVLARERRPRVTPVEYARGVLDGDLR